MISPPAMEPPSRRSSPDAASSMRHDSPDQTESCSSPRPCPPPDQYTRDPSTMPLPSSTNRWYGNSKESSAVSVATSGFSCVSPSNSFVVSGLGLAPDQASSTAAG